MTKPRTSINRLLFGILGSKSSGEQAAWNRYFAEKGMDAFMDRYPTREGNLPERLSEMFHFDRRGYIVEKRLQKAIIPLLDRLDASVQAGEGSGVDTVVNDRGILIGYCMKGDFEERAAFWF